MEDEAFVGRGVVHALESGKRGTNITIDTLVFIAQALAGPGESSADVLLALIYGPRKVRYIDPSRAMKQAIADRRDKRAAYQIEYRRERDESHGRGKVVKAKKRTGSKAKKKRKAKPAK